MNNGFFLRSQYTDGMLLTAADLSAQQRYEDGKRRLLNRAVLGQGVVEGLEAGATPGGHAVRLKKGVALDAKGREVVLPRAGEWPLAELFGEREPGAGEWKLCLRYVERATGEACVLPEPDGVHPRVSNRVEEGCAPLLARAVPEGAVEIATLRLEPGEQGWRVASVARSGRRVGGRAAPAGQSASGSLSVDLTGVAGVWYSEEISHGLGSGPVWVGMSVGERREGRDCLLTGDPALFGAELRTAVKLYPDSGTFVIAARPERFVRSGVTRLFWWAFRAQAQREEESLSALPPAGETGPRPLTLLPSLVRLAPGERVVFKPVMLDRELLAESCIFRAMDARGGTIDPDGCYVAPPDAGVYGIECLDPVTGQSAAAFAVVRGG